MAFRPTALAPLLVLALAGAARAQDPAVTLDPTLGPDARRRIESALAAPGATVVTGDTTLARGAQITGSLVHFGGRLILEGRVTGDVTAVGSDVTLRPGAEIDGNLEVLGGTFLGSGMATVDGRTTWLREASVVVEGDGPDIRVWSRQPEGGGFPIEPKGLWGIVVHDYNGVDGLTFGLAAGLVQPEDQPRTELAFGPVFHTERSPGWDVVGLREIPSAGITIGGRVHRITDTSERWQRPDLGNSLLALALADDDRTYWQRTGYEAWISRRFALPLAVRVRLRDDTYESLASAEPYAFYEGDEGWPENPEIDEGRGRAIGIRAIMDRRNVPEFPTKGLWVRAQGDTWGLGGDFEFHWAEGEVRGWFPLAGRSFVAARAMGGGRVGDGEVPSQFLWRLGGAGSIPGYDALDDSMTGDRMALANVRVHLGLPIDTSRIETLYLVGLADVGDAWMPDEDPAWNSAFGGGVAMSGALRYAGVFLSYGVESETWKTVILLRPWF